MKYGPGFSPVDAVPLRTVYDELAGTLPWVYTADARQLIGK
jgi:hypothetical protein